MTNAVKHFRFRREGRGKRRIRQTPDVSHIQGCRSFLMPTVERAVLDAISGDQVTQLGDGRYSIV